MKLFDPATPSDLATLSDLSTPCALVDLDVVERNTTRMGQRMTELGVRLRPHVKTHSCAEAARLQVRGHFGGITVSTLREARFFAEAGFEDMTLAVPIASCRVREAVELAERVELGLLVDTEEAAVMVDEEARRRGTKLSTWLKVDCGYHRAGVDPERPESRELARRLADSDHVRFRGLLTHAGHSYRCRSAEEAARVAATERDVTVGFARALREDGVAVDEVSVGSTPTLCAVDDLDGVTEARPGNYVFFDAFQVSIGSCGFEDVAFSVLATVIGRHEHRGCLILDAGALALSKDPGATHVDAEPGFGWICTLDGRRLPHLRLVSLSQEHGVVDRTGAGETPAVGERVRVVPNHSCLAAAHHSTYHVVQGEHVVESWKAPRGW